MNSFFTTLYIDPGTGSMLFTILLGVIGTAIYSLRVLFIKLRCRFGAGKADVSLQKIPLVIFAESKRYWPIFEPIIRELHKRGRKVVYLTTSPDDPVLTCAYDNVEAECIENENKMFAKLNFINAAVVLATTPGLQVYQWKRSKGADYYVHIPHAASEITLYRMFGIDFYDAILLSGDYQIEDVRTLEKLRDLPPKELVKVGIPYMDEMAKKLAEAPAVPAHPRTVLLAPSWGPSAIFSVYGGKVLEKLMETGYHVIVRPHPQSFVSEKEMMEKLMAEYPESDRLEWNRDMDNFDVLRRSDILISDFSGVIFDFALIHNKPVIYTNPNFDVSVYDYWWMDTPLWTHSALPRIGRELTEESMEDIKELIDSCIEDEQYADGIRAVKDETWANIGDSAAIVADYLIKKSDKILEREGDKK